MTVSDCVRTMLTQSNITQRELSERLGYSGQGCISKPLSRNGGMGMSVATLIKWSEEMGYQVVIQSAYSDDELILDGELDNDYSEGGEQA